MHDARLSARRPSQAIENRARATARRRAPASAAAPARARDHVAIEQTSLSLRWMACVEGALLPVGVAGRAVLACARAVAPLLYTRYRTPGQMQKGNARSAY